MARAGSSRPTRVCGARRRIRNEPPERCMMLVTRDSPVPGPAPGRNPGPWSPSLVPELSAVQNAALGLRVRGVRAQRSGQTRHFEHTGRQNHRGREQERQPDRLLVSQALGQLSVPDLGPEHRRRCSGSMSGLCCGLNCHLSANRPRPGRRLATPGARPRSGPPQIAVVLAPG